MYPKQQDAIFNSARYAVIEASTKAGKTVGCLAWQLSEAWGGDQSHLWVAPVYAQAKIAYDRLKRWMVRMDPQHEMWDSNDSGVFISLASGSRLFFKGGDNPDSIYGNDYATAVIDEATRCKDAVFHAVRSTTTATRGRIRVIGNVKGRKNWAYQLARKAEAGEQDMHYAKLTAWDAVDGGVLEASEIEDARRQLPERVFNELYMAEPGDDGGNPFGIEHIRRCVMPELAAGPVAAWGVDLGKYQDWTVAIGLNADMKMCVYQRWQSDWRNTTSRLAAMLQVAPSIVDSTGVGDPIVEELIRKCAMCQGERFSQNKKQQWMEGLAVAFHTHTVGIINGPVVNECESFEYEVRTSAEGRVMGVRYSAPPGCHDDCVCALALAVECMRTAPRPASLEVVSLGGEDDGNAQDDMWNEDWTSDRLGAMWE